MLFKTHLAFSFLIGLILIELLEIPNAILFVIIVMFFASLPDIDESSSKVSKKLRPLSFIINIFFKHRGIIHSIYAPLVISIILVLMHQRVYALAVFVGYLSHLILDSLTVMGIQPFSPLIKKRIHGFIKAGSFLENILFMVILVAIACKLFF